MTFTLSVEGLPLPVSDTLIHHIHQQLDQVRLDDLSRLLTLTFRDTSYNAVDGGFHPVEIGLEKRTEHWHINYITDFAYLGYPAELEKEIDFDFQNKVFTHMLTGPLNEKDATDLYQLWETNFLSYLQLDMYDDIKVEVEN